MFFFGGGGCPCVVLFFNTLVLRSKHHSSKLHGWSGVHARQNWEHYYSCYTSIITRLCLIHSNTLCRWLCILMIDWVRGRHKTTINGHRCITGINGKSNEWCTSIPASINVIRFCPKQNEVERVFMHLPIWIPSIPKCAGPGSWHLTISPAKVPTVICTIV